MDNMNLQCIYDNIAPYLPKGWLKAFFRASYSEGSYGMKFYVQTEDGKYVDCYKLPDVSRAQLIRAFMDIDRSLGVGRAALPDEKKWTALVMDIESDGEFHISFEYGSEDENAVSSQFEWEMQFLENT